MTTAFKVIVVGAGPAGLSLAHALSLAKIDFVVLERRETVSMDSGASLVLAPTTLRVMEQFGLLDKLLALGGELKSNKTLDVRGNELGHSEAVQLMRKNHGTAPIAFHRAHLIDAIHDGLSAEAKSKIITGKRISDIISDDNGAVVHCEDGTSYEGDIVIGADGVHSQVRRIMRKMAVAGGREADWDPEVPYTSEYRCLWCSFPHPDSGLGYDTQDRDRSVMYLGGVERSWIFLYERLPQKTRERASYSDRDVDDMAARFAEYPVTEKLKVKDCYAMKITAGMSNLEEGILKHWSYGRIALVGDACHKFTPNAGLGFNNGMQDLVALCNGIYKGVQASPNDSKLDMPTVHSIFASYQAARKSEIQAQFAQSTHTTRMQAWSSPPHYLMARIMGKDFVQKILLNYVASRAISKSLILEYGPNPTVVQGAVPWVHQITPAV
ncbi:hypothetical protein PFICI_00006 [Pestalotiopsis fici W106-1]|uniref:FAD-binding domain-containing protein n=1 Tax=Pestalotiopsis fici (strain W106-1 / CGMCC3.15140) TaxID=1229662 RepID=W3XJE9_PESFW|nr:uncharacterized protein PFICI_00006 [Pestalotiopsis fici W106-1]ETS86178.1 hypothetical protein PFICI_00006 [Pestalotiopsis fici W106-1]